MKSTTNEIIGREPDPRAIASWDKSVKSYNNYVNYIANKETDKYCLSLIDLLYVSNFKGGNGTINEEVASVDKKLKEYYSDALRKIGNAFNDMKLAKLSDDQLKDLTEKIEGICNLTLNEKTHIDGFGASRLSALLHIYFPTLIPILDRRVLLNLKLATSDKEINKRGIHIYYPSLIVKFAKISKDERKEVRDIDRDIFTKKIESPPN